MSLYLSPHTIAVTDAVRAAESTGLPVNVTTIAEAVGSDVTNVVRSCVEENRFGAAAHVLSSYLASDVPVAVSEYTRRVDHLLGRGGRRQARDPFRGAVPERVAISYPAINTTDFLDPDPAASRALAHRGLAGTYVLFLSRLAHAKGVDDLIDGFADARTCADRSW